LEPFDLVEGSGWRGGMTVQISEGLDTETGQSRSIYLTDEAYCFIEPAIERYVRKYSGRWAVTEVPSEAWRATARALRKLAASINQGQPLSSADYIWVHTVDLETGSEIDAERFGRELNADPIRLAKLRDLLMSVAGWIEDSLQNCQWMTISGY
jgi:hypothetical protein